jgi:GntR family transcriptional regulator/MocR family aminotransferase
MARNTVADAYAQLLAEGWLTARQGSGTRVAERLITTDALSPTTSSPGARLRYDLRPGQPDLSLFPRSAWLSAARRALAVAPVDALGYGDPRGRVELRRALSAYLSRARGVRASEEQIVICSGFTQALAIMCDVLGAQGATTMAVEAFGHQHHREVIAARGLRVMPLPVDRHGAVVDHLDGADAALLTPAHQFPIGVALSAERRTAAVRWAASTGATIIEDDYDGEFRYDSHAVGALQALAPEQVVYAGTASKSLAPGLRLAWLVLPAHLLDGVVAAKRLADFQTAVLDQLTLADFVQSGQYDRHIRKSRLAYRRRRDRLVDAIGRRAPGVAVTGIAAGMHAVLELAPDQEERQLVAMASARGLALDGLGTYAVEALGHRPALVVGYGTPPAHAYTTAIARLCAILDGSAG